ncbi:MAG: J domain-containing protein [Bryobacteraceae bacterium]
MTYYEELGLAQNATVEEIHQAYRNLARLLHPDQQTDETLRHLAESQMKRINLIHEVLTNPAMRREYDVSLRPDRPGLPGRTVPATGRRSIRSFKRPAWLNTSSAAWALIAVIAGLSLYIGFQWEDKGPAPVSQVQAPVETAQPIPQPSRTDSASITRQTAPEQPKTAPKESVTAKNEPAPELEQPPSLPIESANLPSVVSHLESQHRAEQNSPSPIAGQVDTVSHSKILHVNGRFAGTWVYVRSKDSENSPGLYPPEYIEAVISEHDGVIRGRYRARYVVKDRVISPEVRLQFAGEGDRDSAHLKWTGAGGARGDIQLRLVTERSLEVNWMAEELGTEMGLISGTAVLTRREER